MTDKIQKIKDWISKAQDGLMDDNGNFEYPEHEGAFHILCNLDAYIDSLQEEPVSEDFEKALAREWKGYIDRGAATVDALEDNTQELAFAKGFYRGAQWDKNQAMAEIQSQSMALAHSCPKEEPVSEDLENIVEEIAEPTILNAYGTKELARRLRNTICGTSVSEGLEDAAVEWFNSIKYKSDLSGTPIEGFKAGAKWQLERVKEALLSEVLPCFMHGGEADEEVAKLNEVLNQKK